MAIAGNFVVGARVLGRALEPKGKGQADDREAATRRTAIRLPNGGPDLQAQIARSNRSLPRTPKFLRTPSPPRRSASSARQRRRDPRDRLVLTIGYLFTEAESLACRPDGRVTPAHVLGIDQATGFGLVQALGELDARRSSSAIPARPAWGRDVAAGAGQAGARMIVGKQEFAGYWEYLLDEAIFTVPAHPFGAAPPDRRGRQLLASARFCRANQPDSGPSRHQHGGADRPAAADPRRPAHRAGHKPPRPWLGVFRPRMAMRSWSERRRRGPAAEAGMRAATFSPRRRGNRRSRRFLPQGLEIGPPGPRSRSKSSATACKSARACGPLIARTFIRSGCACSSLLRLASASIARLAAEFDGRASAAA